MTLSSDLSSPWVTPRRLMLLVGCIALVQLLLAARLDLYSDEIFYWQASTHPALAYSDLPFMTALLTGLGSSLLHSSALAVRIPFILMGAAIPWVLVWQAVPLVGRQRALEAGALSLCIPLAGFLGLLAVPDVPLILFGLLTLGCFERALRSDDTRYWVASGMFAALGFSTHYRFFAYALAALLFLLLFPAGRQYWKSRGLWISLVISLPGLVPIVWFNSNYDLSSLGFYFIDRHPWSFQPQGLLHLFKQMILVTPPMYILLAFVLWTLFKGARKGDSAQGLLFCVTATNLGVYLLLAPWTDSTSTSIHWPLSGYFPLLIFAPGHLQNLRDWLQLRYKPAVARRLAMIVPIMGLIGTSTAFVTVGSQAFHRELYPLLGSGLLSDKMAGWQEFSQNTEALLERESGAPPYLLVSDNYYTSAQAAFYLSNSILAYTIDNDKAVRDGRRAQYAIWQRDADGLVLHSPLRNGLFVTEDSTLTIPDKTLVLQTMCRLAGKVEFLDQLQLLNGDKRFSYYRFAGTGVQFDTSDYPCPFPSQGWIDTPVADDVLSGITEVGGWVFNEDIGVRSVAILIDEELVGYADYGLPRPDVAEVMQVKTDPQSPGLGFHYNLDTRTLPNGRRTIAVRFTNHAGESQDYGRRSVTVQNR